MKYNMSKLMKKAWSLFKKGHTTFSAALKAAWQWIKVQAANDAIIAAAAKAAGVADMVYKTWFGWKAAGRMVIHTSKAAFQCEIADPTTKKGTRVQSFFLYTDTQPAPMA